jgi:hypothetical protein
MSQTKSCSGVHDVYNLQVLFETPPVEQTLASEAFLTAEDAQLDPVALALKYAFGLSAFRGEQQVCIQSSSPFCLLADETNAPCQTASPRPKRSSKHIRCVTGSCCSSNCCLCLPAGDSVRCAGRERCYGVDANGWRQKLVLPASRSARQWPHSCHYASHLLDV